MVKTYFISGHLDLSEEDFRLHYVPKIDNAIEEGANFIIGDAFGADLMAQLYLKENNIATDKVTICHMYKKPKNKNPSNYPTIGGFKNHDEKDSYMTEHSDEDIAYVRSIEEQKRLYGDKYRYRISGTEKNIIRRYS